MGLDIVEIIMRAEEEFGIEILDSEAELLATPGALCDLIAYKLARTAPEFPASRSSCPTSRAFYAVRRELMHLGLERNNITPKTSIATLWAPSRRRQNWKALGEALDYELPPLKRDSAWAFAGLLPLGVFPIWFAISPASAGLYFALYLLLWWIGSYLTQPFAVHAPDYLNSVADLSRCLGPRYGTAAQGSQADLWPLVRALIGDECGLPLESVTHDADFVRDLGLG